MPYLKSKNYQIMMELIMSNETRYRPLVQFSSAVMDSTGELTRAEKEEIVLLTPGLNGCAYCIGDHSAVLKNLDVDPARIRVVVSGSLEGVSEKIKPLLEFVEKLTQNSVTTGQADIAAVSDAGWSDQAIEDAICICVLFGFFNRPVSGTGLKGTPEQCTQTGKRLSQGYT